MQQASSSLIAAQILENSKKLKFSKIKQKS